MVRYPGTGLYWLIWNDMIPQPQVAYRETHQSRLDDPCRVPRALVSMKAFISFFLFRFLFNFN